MNGCHFYISHFFFYILHLINKSRGNGKLPLDLHTNNQTQRLTDACQLSKTHLTKTARVAGQQ